MKFYKSKFVPIMLLVAMIFSLISTPIVNGAKKAVTTTEAAKFLEEVGVLKGDNGNLMLDKKLSRQDAVVLLSRLLGLENEAKSYPTKGMTFKDIVDKYYAPYIAWAQDNELVNGYSSTKFGYGDSLTTWQTKALMVRALGYTDTPDEEIDEMAELLGVSYGSTAQNTASITRADMALLAYNTVQAETVDGQILGEVLGLFDEVDQPVLTGVKTSATTTSDDNVTISGTVSPAKSKVLVGKDYATVDSNGNFSIKVSLKQGENLFDVVAQNGYKTDVVEVKVDRAAGCVMRAEVKSNNSIKVIFSSTISNIDEVNFELKGTSTVYTNVTWSSDRKEATLEAPSTLAEGTYTLTVKGIDLVDNKNTISLVIAKSGIAKIEIIGTAITFAEFPGRSAEEGNLAIAYKLYDYYGNDITNSANDNELEIVTNIELKGSKYYIDRQNGKIYFEVKESTGQLKVGNNVTVTIIAKETGVSSSKSLKVSEKGQADNVVIKGIQYRDSAVKKILIKDGIAAYINIEVFDQYGVEILDPNLIEDGKQLLHIISDKNLIITPEKYTDENNATKLRFVVNTLNMTTAKNVNITLVSKLSGKSVSTTLELKEKSKPSIVKIGAPEQMVAAGDRESSLIVPITVYDQDGVMLTVDEVVAAYEDGKIRINGSGSLADAGLRIQKTGKNKGKIVNASNISSEGTGIITVTADSDVVTTSISIKEKAYAKTIKLENAPATNLLDGADTTCNYTFYDQYNRKIENPSSSFKVTLESSNPDIIKVNLSNTNASIVSEENSVKITSAGKEGSATITAQLYKTDKVSPTWPADYTSICTVRTTISVTKGVPSSLIFEIEAIPTLVAIDGYDTRTDGDDKYARPIKITAKDSSGKVYAIPDSRIIRVTSENATDNRHDADTSKYIMISEAKVNGYIKAQQGYYVVGARELKDIAWNDNDTVSTNIKVLIATDAGVKEVTQKVTISKIQPKPVEIIFVYMPNGGTPVDINANPYKLNPEAEKIEEIKGTVAHISEHKIYVYSRDQYGVYKSEPTTQFRVINTDRYKGNTIDYETDYTIENFSKNDILKDKEVYLMYETSNGIYGTFKIIATDGQGNF